MVRSAHRSAFAALLLTSLSLGCGGGGESTLPDETADLDVDAVRTSSHVAGTEAVGPEIGGTRWRWVEAHCTEGEPALAGQGFAQFAELTATPQGVVFVYDQKVDDGEGAQSCIETVVQRATPGPEADSEWRISEEARVTFGVCPTEREADRPGDVRRRGDFLEVYVQRSVWCNGLEVRHVFAPAPPRAHDGAQVLRHYVAHFNRQDPAAVTSLFAQQGSLVEPFDRTPEGNPTRHDGRQAIYEWYEDAFQNTPWLAMRPTRITPGATDGTFVLEWLYMDPRLDVPFAGRNLFLIAAGEIFEGTIEITEQTTDPEAEVGPAEDLTRPAPTSAPTSAATTVPGTAAGTPEGSAPPGGTRGPPSRPRRRLLPKPLPPPRLRPPSERDARLTPPPRTSEGSPPRGHPGARALFRFDSVRG